VADTHSFTGDAPSSSMYNNDNYALSSSNYYQTPASAFEVPPPIPESQRPSYPAFEHEEHRPEYGAYPDNQYAHMSMYGQQDQNMSAYPSYGYDNGGMQNQGYMNPYLVS